LTKSKKSGEVAKEIRDEYAKGHFEYLMIIAPPDEIPVHDDAQNAVDAELYGDIDSDGWIDLSVGRLPFDTAGEVREYFNGLYRKRSSAAAFKYTFGGDVFNDDNLVRQYLIDDCTFGKTSFPMMQYRLSSVDFLLSNFASKDYVKISTHGSANGFCPANMKGTENASLEKIAEYKNNVDMFNYRCLTDQELEGLYFRNRPIINMQACSTAAKFGLKAMKAGAGAYIGDYTPGGGTNVDVRIFSGLSLGDVLRQEINEISLSTIQRKSMERGFQNYQTGKIPANDVNSLNRILYGDPSIRLVEKRDFGEGIIAGKNAIRFHIEPDPVQMEINDNNILDCYRQSIYYRSYPRAEDFSGNHQVLVWLKTENIKSVDTIRLYSDGKMVQRFGGVQFYRSSDSQQMLYLTLNTLEGKDKDLVFDIDFTPAD
jgi:hypothetical protein